MVNHRGFIHGAVALVLLFIPGVVRAQADGGGTLVVVGKVAQHDSGAPASAVTVRLTVPGDASGSRQVSVETSRQGLYDLIYESKVQMAGSVYLSCAPPVRCRARRIDFANPQASIRTATLEAPLLVRSAVLPGGAIARPLVVWHLSAILEAAVLDRLALDAAPDAVAKRVRSQSATVLRMLSGYPTGDEIDRLLTTSRAQVSTGELRALPGLSALLAELAVDAQALNLPGGLASGLAGRPLGQTDSSVPLLSPADELSAAPDTTAVPLMDNPLSEILWDTPSGDADEELAGEVIVLTGTAIRRPVPHDLVPVTILDRQMLDASGLASVGEFLQDLPMQYNGGNRQFNNGGDGTTRFNLRGLGTERTLVLINNRRYLPGGLGANKSVDLDDVPMAMLQRIEVLSGGASAVYGAGAMSGVVNLVLRDDVEGAEATGYVGTTGDGSGTVYDVSAMAGYSSERGRGTIALSFFDQQPIMAKNREFSQFEKFYDWVASQADPDSNPNREDIWYPNGSSAPPHGYLNDRLGQSGNQAWQDVINGSCQSGVCRIDTMSDFQFPGESGLGDLYNYQSDNYLLTPLRRVNVFATGSYNLGRHVRAFADFLFTHHESAQQMAPTPLFIISEGMAVDENNFYNPYGRPFIDIRRRIVEAGPRRFQGQRRSLRSVVGVSGEIPARSSWLAGWRWAVHGNLGDSRISITQPSGGLVRSRIEQALGPSYVDGSNTPRCGTQEQPGTPECVPLNLFGGPGSITRDMLDYISAEFISVGSNRHWLVGFEAEGKLLRTPWNGDVRLALGAETRTTSGSFLPDPLLVEGDTTRNRQIATDGSYTIRAAWTELSAVPVVGRPGARWLEFDAALRLAQADHFRDISTWRLGVAWKPWNPITLRAVHSRDARAPNLNELFLESAQSFANVVDPCDNSQQMPSSITRQNCIDAGIPSDFTDERTQIATRTGGAVTTLTAEPARTLDLRLIAEPPAWPGLRLSVTYFNIGIYQQITGVGAPDLLAACYSEVTPHPAACDLIQRDPETGLILFISDVPFNTRTGLTTAGIDTAIEYRHHTSIGHFRHQLLATRLQTFLSSQLYSETEGVGVYDLGLFPRWKFNASSMWSGRRFGASLAVRYIGSITECEEDLCRQGGEFDPLDNPAPLSRTVGASITADVQGRFTFNHALGTSIIELGINNIANSSYVTLYNGFYATSDAATYDFAGRYGYLRMTQKF